MHRQTTRGARQILSIRPPVRQTTHPRNRRSTAQNVATRLSHHAPTQGPWFSGTTHCREGEAPAEPHPCRERVIDPPCAAKTLANVHSADQRSVARLEPRRPKSSPGSQNFREYQGHWAAAQWHWLSDKTQCREGEAPAEPHPCRERFFDPRCAAKTLANAHSADQRSAARLEPRPPRSSTVFSQNFRESQCHWVTARGCVFAPWCARRRQRVASTLYPQAAARRLIAFSLLTSHFLLLSTFYSLRPRAASRPAAHCGNSAVGIESASALSLPGGGGITYDRICSMTRPCTSVRRRSIPEVRKVVRLWSSPMRCRMVAYRSWLVVRPSAV
ncbi:MAG: hypothetical protein RLZZ436_225 [Planctomycetota bacterium]